MKKLIKSFIFAFFAFAFFASASFASAQDFKITCTTGSCTQDPSGAIFNSTNIYPGWSITKVIKGINNYSQDATFATNLSNLINTQDSGSTGNLSDVLVINFKKTGSLTIIYEDTLTNFKNYGYLKLSDISSGGNQDYDVNVTMQTSADNEYQSVQATFDLILGFELIPLPSQAPGSPTPGSSEPGSPGPAVSPSPFFGGAVAGVATEALIEPSASVGELFLPQVKGESTSNNNYFWWLLLLIPVILGWIYFYRKRK